MKFIEKIKKIKNFFGKEHWEFLDHSKNYFSGQFVKAAMAFISIPILTRLLLPAEYGIISIFLSIVILFAIIMRLNIQSAVNRYFFEKTNDFGSFLGTILAFIISFNLLILPFLYIFKDDIAIFFNLDSNVVFFAIIVASLSIPMEIYLIYLNASKNSKKFAILSALKNTLILILAIILIVLSSEKKYMGFVYSHLIITLLFSIYTLYPLLKISKLDFHVKYIKYALLFCLPLLPNALSGYVLDFFDRIIIQQLLGSTKTGLYSFAYNVGILLQIWIVSLNKSWMPMFFGYLKDKQYDKIKSLSLHYSKYVFIVALGLILFSKEIIMILAEEKYYAALDLVPVIVMGFVFYFLVVFYSQYYIFEKKTMFVSISTFIAVGFNIGTNYWLIPIYGYSAAAYTTLASFFLLFILRFITAKYLLKQNIVPLQTFLPGLGLLIISTLIYITLISYFQNFFFIFIIKTIIFILVGYCFFSKIIYKIRNKNENNNIKK